MEREQQGTWSMNELFIQFDEIDATNLVNNTFS